MRPSGRTTAILLKIAEYCSCCEMTSFDESKYHFKIHNQNVLRLVRFKCHLVFLTLFVFFFLSLYSFSLLKDKFGEKCCAFHMRVQFYGKQHAFFWSTCVWWLHKEKYFSWLLPSAAEIFSPVPFWGSELSQGFLRLLDKVWLNDI